MCTNVARSFFMDTEMFCFQCEQTGTSNGCRGCTGKVGVCGKTAEVARLQDELTGALIGLARAAEQNGKTEKATRLILEGLFTTITNVNFNEETLHILINRVVAEKNVIALSCESCNSRCGNTDIYDMQKIWTAQVDVRSLKSLILFGIRGIAAYAYHALMLGYQNEEVNNFFYKALYSLAEDWGKDELLPIVMETGKVNLACMELLDTANTSSFGVPVPTSVTLTVEKGPFIVISGHDLNDLKLLLEQTNGKGVNVYTHGEMLPAHAYVELKKYPQLKGNFGTAWQNQQKEFDQLPGVVLYTTNCLMPPRPTYAGNLYTTAEVGWPGVTHIAADVKGHKDFSGLIDHAIRLGG